MMPIPRVLAGSAVGLAVVLACAVPPRPVGFDPQAQQPATTDGLYRLRSTRVAAVFARPGVSLAGYASVLIDPVTVAYKDPPRPASDLSRARGNYALDDTKMDRLKRFYRAAFEHELVEEGPFAAATAAGPGVLRVAGHIVNLVVNAPVVQGRNRAYVFDAGQMTLVLDVRDAESGEALLRIVDRRGIRPGATPLAGAYESLPATNTGAVRDLLFEWAAVSRDWIDLLRATAVPQAPPASDRG
jgi:hypothetical protein